MLRGLLMLFLLVMPAAALAGTRATYAAPHRRPMVVQIDDNGDMAANLQGGMRLIVRADRAYIVDERLTGPLVTPLDDLAALMSPPRRPQASGAVDERATRELMASMDELAERLPPSHDTEASSTEGGPSIVQRGTADVNGRSGGAYFFTHATGRAAERPAAVISNDPALQPLGRAVRRIIAAEAVVGAVYYGWPRELSGENDWLALLDLGGPLSFGDWSLRSVERVPIDPAAFALPAEPETADALGRRRASEARADEGRGASRRMISRAVFADGRLWLLGEDGTLSSLADGEQAQRPEAPGDRVLDLCVQDGQPLVLTGRTEGPRWTVRRLERGSWARGRAVARSGDTPIALSCDAAGVMLLTDRRLVDLAGDAPSVAFSEALGPALVRAVAHITPDAAYLGLDQGEWGGGLRRIDRRTGEVRTIERNATGGLCDGPLNTSCDPVNGIVTIPWRPNCIAVAIGLIHMMAQGRIASVCPEGIDQLFAAADAETMDPGNPEDVAKAASGSFGSVAFFGLAATRDALLAVGHDGLYRIDANGAGTRRPWPRFTEVDGLLVSFALPDVVLVMTGINGHAALSGITPLMAVR